MTQAAERPVVLVVDDATEILALVAKALRSDYFVLTADPGSALELAVGSPREERASGARACKRRERRQRRTNEQAHR